MRVYLPATLPLLATALSAGAAHQFPAGPGFAVTPGMREWYASGDTEELEHVAMSLAAEASVPLIAADPAAARRRVVVVADVDPVAVTPGAEADRASRGRVLVTRPIPMSRLAAVHVDHDDAVAAVTAAAADLDDEFAAEEAADHELLWYATQELDQLVLRANED
jgi:hypothetical protein